MSPAADVARLAVPFDVAAAVAAASAVLASGAITTEGGFIDPNVSMTCAHGMTAEAVRGDYDRVPRWARWYVSAEWAMMHFWVETEAAARLAVALMFSLEGDYRPFPASGDWPLVAVEIARVAGGRCVAVPL